MPQLTGRRRLNVEHPLFGEERLVLQVEERDNYIDSTGGYIEVETFTRWRNARVTDLTERDDIMSLLLTH